MASIAKPQIASETRSLLVYLTSLFVVSRLVIVAISLAAYNHFQQELDLPWNEWMTAIWAKWDVSWYTRIAHHGYDAMPFNTLKERSWGFLPLYPMTIKAFVWLFHTTKFSIVGSLISCASSFSALWIFINTFKDRISNRKRFLFLYLASAGSLYLSIPYAESLGLLLLACTFHFTKEKKYWLAAIMAGLAAITRLQLVALLLIPLGALLFDPQIRRKILHAPVMVALFGIPTLVHMAYLHSLTGNAFAFFDVQAAWGNPNPYPLESLVVFILKGIKNPPLQWFHLYIWSLFAAILIRNYKKIPLNELIFCIVVFLISTGSERFYAAYRYVLMLIPLYIALANEEEWFRNFYIYSNLILGTMYVIAFVNVYKFSL
ncbi:MAG TPA: hypothetical protein VLF94_03155 [Chlamydiales bacterium]|nr:hypothetical protein [Chlamydiales bacterium]